MKPLLTSACLVLAVGSAASGQILDTFSSGTNSGGWSFGGPSEVISPSGGNPGAYLRSSGLDTTIPWLRCTEGTPFTGNFRAQGVTSASIDVNVFATDFNIGAFPLSLILVSDNGTPGNANDDWGVYLMGAGIPAPGTGWKHVTFSVPSQSPTVPTGWNFIQFGAGSPASPNWTALITNVSRLEFSFGDPSLFYIFQQWTVGADNIGLTWAPLCYANCDFSSSPPILNANDFQCFLHDYAVQSSRANCDGSTTAPVLNVNDFQCFLNAFAVGCT